MCFQFEFPKPQHCDEMEGCMLVEEIWKKCLERSKAF